MNGLCCEWVTEKGWDQGASELGSKVIDPRGACEYTKLSVLIKDEDGGAITWQVVHSRLVDLLLPPSSLEAASYL